MTETDKHADMRVSILAAAEKIFDARGFAATTMDAVAEEAGIAKGSIYNYFHNKHDLFDKVFADAVTGDETDIEKLIAQAVSACDKLERYLDHWWQRLEHYRRIGFITLEYWTALAREHRDSDNAMGFANYFDKWRENLARIIDQGIKSGEFGSHLNPQIGAAMIMAITSGLTLHAILGAETDLDEDFLRRMKRGIYAALSSRTGHGSQA